MSEFNEENNIEIFIDNVVSNNIELKVNSIVVGEIEHNIQEFLKKQEIFLLLSEIRLTYKGIRHTLRDNKNPLQKVSVEQLKTIKKIIKNNNVYYDTQKKNLIYIGELPQREVVNGRNIIKIPINIKQYNSVATVSIVPDISITNDKRYKKID